MRKFKVRRSKIEGRGLYATEAINKHEEILVYSGPVVDPSERHLQRRKHEFLMMLNDGRCIDGVKNIGRFMNHSCRPNIEHNGTVIDPVTQFLGQSIIAKRKIAPGEELLLDYGLDTSGTALHACRCGSNNCRGYLNSREDLRMYRKNNK